MGGNRWERLYWVDPLVCNRRSQSSPPVGRTGPRHGLPDLGPDGPRRLLRQARQLAAPRRLGLPPVWGAPRAGRPPPPPRPDPRLPLRGLPPRVQRLHWDAPSGHQAAARRAGADPPRRRPGGAHRPARPRAGLRPQGVTPAAAPAPARGLLLPRPKLAGRRGDGGRRDVPKCGGKKGSRTSTPPTRRGVAGTAPPAMAPGRATGRRSVGWWAARAARSG